jgi:hypothetical protein
VLLLYALLTWRLRLPAPRLRNDDAQYILLARSLLDLHYRDLFLVGGPHHTQYPPGYPLVLAVLGSLFGERWDVFIAANVACALLALAILFDVARRVWTPTVAVAGLAVAALVPAWIYPYGPAINVLADGPYTALAFASLWILAVKPRSAPWMVAAAGLAIAAALTRSVGVTLVAAVGLLWLLERRWKAAAGLALAATLTVGAWLGWTLVADSDVVGRSYVADALFDGPAAGPAPRPPSVVSVLAIRLRNNLVGYGAREVPKAFGLPFVEGTVLDNLLGAGLLATLIAAGALPLWRRWRGAAIYGASYGALLLAWPWVVPRFLVPVLPVMALTAVAGAATLARRTRVAPALALGAALMMIVPAAEQDLRLTRAFADICQRHDPRGSCNRPAHEGYMEAVAFLRDSLPDGEAVASAKEATIAYLTGRDVLPLYAVLGGDPDGLAARLRDRGVGYALLGSVGTSYDRRFQREVAEGCRGFRVVRAFRSQALLVRVSPNGSGEDCEAIRAFDQRRGADAVS